MAFDDVAIAMSPSLALLGQRHFWRALVATWLGCFCDGFDGAIYFIVLYPAVSEVLGTTSHSQVGEIGTAILSLFLLGFAVGGVLFGMVSDRIGRSRALLFTILLYSLSSGLCAFSYSWQELAAYRFLAGCGIGGEVGAGVVLLSEIWPTKQRAHAIAFIITALCLGQLAASAIGLWLTLTWRTMFLLGALPAVLALFVRWRSIETLALKEVASDTGIAEQERNSSFLSILNADNMAKIAPLTVIAASSVIGAWVIMAWVPAWINQMTGNVSVAERSMAATIMTLGAILSNVLSGVLVRKLGAPVALRITLLGAFIFCITMYQTVKTYGTGLLAWCFIANAFATVPAAILCIYLPELFGKKIRTTAFGVTFNTGRIIGAVFAVAGGKFLAVFDGSYAKAATALAGFFLFGIIATYCLPRQIPSDAVD